MLGWNDVSWHNPNIHSPTLEKLAYQGILLDQYYVNPTCSPSRTAFMTGQYPHRLGRQHMYIKPMMPNGDPADVKVLLEYLTSITTLFRLCQNTLRMQDTPLMQ